MTYDSVFNEYIDTLVASNRTQLQGLSTNPQYEHNFMANHLLEYLADGLREFDGNAINDERYYWYLAWKGLYATNTWKQHWPNYPSKPITGAPYTTDDSTRGLKYALTPTRIDSINIALNAEYNGYSNARGRKPVPGGCY